MVYSEPTLKKLKEILNNHYIKSKSTVDRGLNVIISGKQYLEDLNTSELASSVATQDFNAKVSILTDKI